VSRLQPYAGCITLSFSAVERSIERLCLISSIPLTIARSFPPGVKAGGKLHPVPMIERFSFDIKNFYPAITVVAPMMMLAPQPAMSPTRSNGRPPTNTEELPAVNGVAVGCGVAGVGTMAQTCISPTTAAGMPPIITLETPGPVTEPPCAVLSPTLAANGILYFFVAE
jgi:hypothetical protein